MKKIKKPAALVLTALMLLCLCACGDFESKMVKAAADMSKLQSLHMDVILEAEMEFTVLNRSRKAELSLESAIDTQREPAVMRLENSLTLMGFTQDSSLYVAQNGGIYDVYSSLNGGNWLKETREKNKAPSQIDLMDSFSLFSDCAASFKEAGSEEIMGAPATRYDGEISGENIRRALDLTGAEDFFEESLGVPLGQLSEDAGIPVSVWLDESSGKIVRFDMDLAPVMSSAMDAVLSKVTEENALSGAAAGMSLNRLHASAVLSGFDSIGSIEIPAEALD